MQNPINCGSARIVYCENNNDKTIRLKFCDYIEKAFKKKEV
jgi:hypothetical protein